MKEIYDLLPKELKIKFSKIKLIVMDFDGVLTDNKVIHYKNDLESVRRSRRDSFAIDLLKDAKLYDKSNYEKTEHKIDLLILSQETSPIVESVAKKIKIKCAQSVYEKDKILVEEIANRGISFENTCFIGNDLNDLECIKKSGIGIAVADSDNRILKVADYITKTKGGQGAFREICELVLYAKGIHPYF